jgi:hypothetical protein
MVERLPGARVATVILWIVLLAGLGLGLASYLGRAPSPQIDERVAISVLKSEDMAFLVTRRTATQIVVDHTESDWSGEWRGVLWCSVSWRWGVDLQKITPRDIHHEGKVVIVRLPEPELLDFALVPGSEGFISKSTALPKLMDFSRGGSQRQLLERQVREQALRFAAEQKLLPSRSEIAHQLNEAAGILSKTAGVEMRFE